MKSSSHSFNEGAAIPGSFAFAVINPVTHISLSSNRNPHLAWAELHDIQACNCFCPKVLERLSRVQC